MLLHIFLVVLVFALICVALYFYVDWKVDKEIEQEHKERIVAESRLTESLKTLCTQLGIGLSYHEKLGTAAGRILYHSMNGRLFVDDARIEFREIQDEPYTLAHELGHYMAIKQRQDSSEEGADTEADKLCRLILNDNEQRLLAISLRCYFHQMEVVE